jgi:hypothetical protein
MTLDGLALTTLQRWRADPVAFVRENFKVEPDAWQVDALQAFADPKKPLVSLQACAGPGKSAVLAWCGLWFLACQGEPGDHPKGYAVSVTSDNLRSNLWPELAKWMQRSPFLSHCFEWTSSRVTLRSKPATWFLEARSWPKTASPEEQGKTLSGLHGGYVAALIDESGAIPSAVSRAAQQALSTDVQFGCVMQAGNPLTTTGMLHEAAQSGAWHVIRVTGDPDDPKRSPRVSIEWARQQIATYGRDNPWVQAYILGQFPAGGINQLLSADEIRAAMKRVLREQDVAHAARILGVDVAREGDDASCAIQRQGLVAYQPKRWRNIDSIQGAGSIARLWQDWDADAVFVDNTGGFGGGWVDQLRALNFDPRGVHFSEEPSDRRYLNKRAEMYFLLAEWVRAGGCLPDVPDLVAELSTQTYSFKGDRVQLEDKRQIKARLGRSPDTADALALTFAHPVAARRNGQRDTLKRILDAGSSRRRDYNPFARM